jgi:membrane protein DedA with SNARE-associated domain
MIGALVSSYGYLAVFAGALLEGETILVAAGFAAHRGLLDWWAVIGVAFVGATLGDQIAFLLGRWKGAALMARFPALAEKAPRVLGQLERHAGAFIVVVRFLYGLRIAGPLVIGASRVSFARFAFFNMIGAAVWAPLVAGAGYAFGLAIESLFDDLRRFEEALLLAILVAGLAIWLWRRGGHRPPRP